MDLLDLILSLQKKTLSREIRWEFLSESDIPEVVLSNTNITIISCFLFVDSVSNIDFYVYEYNYRNYVDVDEWYIARGASLVLVLNGLIYDESSNKLVPEIFNLLRAIRKGSSMSFDHLLN